MSESATASFGHDHRHHGHQHAHHHHHRSENRRRLTIVLVLVLAYMAAEAIGGLLTGSLALLADAGHMLSDAASLGLALFALWIAVKPPNSDHTYGYLRTEILAALLNGATLVAISIFIFIEAYQRWQDPPDIEGGPMMAIAFGGLVVNLVGLWLLHGGREESLNIKGAWMHVMADTLGSVQVLVAGGLIWTLGWNWVDPLASFLIAILVLFSSWDLLSESVSILMERAPGHVNVDAVRYSMKSSVGVLDVHDLHVWTITSGRVALSAHVTCAPETDRDRLLGDLGNLLRNEFHVYHSTIQVESSGYRECPEEQLP